MRENGGRPWHDHVRDNPIGCASATTARWVAEVEERRRSLKRGPPFHHSVDALEVEVFSTSESVDALQNEIVSVPYSVDAPGNEIASVARSVGALESEILSVFGASTLLHR